MSDQYVSSDFLDGIVVWQKAPHDEPIIVDGEEGMPYFSPDGHCMLAILKEGQFIDSISIDITTQKVTSNDDTSQKDMHSLGEWGNHTPRLVVNKSVVMRAMRYRAKLRQIGWTDNRLHFEFSQVANTIGSSKETAPIAAMISARNFLSKFKNDIPMLAISAYECFKTFGPRKWFRKRIMDRMKDNGEEDVAASVMKLALHIGLLNPCLGEHWEKGYTRQGMRNHKQPPSALEITLESLLERLAHIEAQEDYHDDYDEWFGDDIAALEKAIALVQQDIEFDKLMKRRQVDAVQAVKAHLTEMGLPCNKNNMEEEWAQFVAAAWGVIPSQVISAANKI
ncbi:hypothetical protein [Aeromonas dhakensis]|uniref:hypothetical protein n=1 Tax=Aeromonas dhakensis TaxID=196024 RepID=UPI001FCC125F|nr:hypothetical protein [Aeromonas dhakensis]MCJ2367331.1 hypothetical protein [Aeromonas dhakensis]